MTKLALIANAQLLDVTYFALLDSLHPDTPYGKPDAPLLRGLWQGQEIVVLSRNGERGTLAPHDINYRANIWALNALGVERIIAFALANGIRADIRPGSLVIPDQLIDYTHARDNTFYHDEFNAVRHVDFRQPYTEHLRQHFIDVAQVNDISLLDSAVYGVTEGPRLYTLAEINRFERDGCDVLGMTGMPETILARELGLEYASILLVTNKAAGRQVTLDPSVEERALCLKESVSYLYTLFNKAIV